MGIVSRFERRLRNTVDDAFARVFGGSVMPKEVETALEREAVDHIRELDGGHQLAPNSYVITINSTDHEKLAAEGDTAKRQFSRHLQDYIKAQGWQTYGDVGVEFEASPSLHTGQFRARGIVDPDVGRRPAPHKPQQPGAVMPQNSGPDEGRNPPQARTSRRRAIATGISTPHATFRRPSSTRARATARTRTTANTRIRATPITAKDSATRSRRTRTRATTTRARTTRPARRTRAISATTNGTTGIRGIRVRPAVPRSGLRQSGSPEPGLRRPQLRSRSPPRQPLRRPHLLTAATGRRWRRLPGVFAAARLRAPRSRPAEIRPEPRPPALRLRGPLRRARQLRRLSRRRHLLRHPAARRRQRAHLPATRRQQHRRPRARCPLPASGHRRLAPPLRGALGRPDGNAQRPGFDERHDGQRRPGAGLATRRRRRDSCRTLRDHHSVGLI